jgi:hypothetical protein
MLGPALAFVPVGLTRDGMVVRYVYRDDDGTGIVGVEARFGSFAGASAAWFADDSLLEFADQLCTYPLGDQRFQVSGGYRSEDGEVDEHVGLTVRAIGHRGLVGVLAHLATPDDHVDYGALVSEVRVEVMTSYEALGRFSHGLARLIRGERDEAELDAEVVGVG